MEYRSSRCTARDAVAARFRISTHRLACQKKSPNLAVRGFARKPAFRPVQSLQLHAAIYLGVEPGTAGAAAAAVAAAAAAASAAALAASAAASTTAAAASEAGAAGSTAGTTTTAGASTAAGAGAGAGAASSFLPQAASAAAAIRAARTREFFISIFLFGQTSIWKAMAPEFF